VAGAEIAQDPEAETGGPPTGDLALSVAPAHLRAVCLVLRDHADLRFDYPADLCGVDMGTGIRLWYRFWSPEHGRSATIEVMLSAENSCVPSVCDIWPGLDWFERECFDMFGVRFEGHPRADNPTSMRILLPEDWVGYPFRKDYKPEFAGDPLHGPQETN